MFISSTGRNWGITKDISNLCATATTRGSHLELAHTTQPIHYSALLPHTRTGQDVQRFLATVAVVVTSDAWYHQTKPQRNVASSRAFKVHFIQVSFLGYQPLYFPQVTLCDQNGYTLFSLNPVNFVGAWKQQEISPPVGRLNQRNLPF